MDPEDQARLDIDKMLEASGWDQSKISKNLI